VGKPKFEWEEGVKEDAVRLLGFLQLEADCAQLNSWEEE